MRIIIKIGTSTITDNNGLLNKKYIAELAKCICELQAKNDEIIIVSSGAIGAGLSRLKLKNRPKTLREKQALAAIGQPIVMDAYAQAFSKHNKTVAQILLTREDFDSRVRYINARNTLCELVERGVIPIINENDSISIDEIKFGDNDTLSALVASAVDADKLVIFTDVEGLYEGNPSRGLLINRVEKITEDIESFATSKSASGKGTGGMLSKVLAAKIATSAGVDTIIMNGSKTHLLKEAIVKESVGTFFKAKNCQLEAKKCWIAFSKKPKGSIFVDKKAAEALMKKGKSLLPAGIVKVSGNFKRGDTVSIFENGAKDDFAKGLVNYSYEEISKIKGKKTGDLKNLINIVEDEVIHRDNLVIL